MNWDRVEGNWKQIKGNVKTKWGQTHGRRLNCYQWQAGTTRRQACVYRKSTPGRSGGEGRQRLRETNDSGPLNWARDRRQFIQ